MHWRCDVVRDGVEIVVDEVGEVCRGGQLVNVYNICWCRLDMCRGGSLLFVARCLSCSCSGGPRGGELIFVGRPIIVVVGDGGTVGSIVGLTNSVDESEDDAVGCVGGADEAAVVV